MSPMPFRRPTRPRTTYTRGSDVHAPSAGVCDACCKCHDQRGRAPGFPCQANIDRWDVGHGDVGDSWLDEGGRDRSWQEADCPAGGDVLQFFLEVVDCGSWAGLAAVGSWVDIVEGLPAGAGTALDDHRIVGELGDRDLALACSRMTEGNRGDTWLRAHRHELQAAIVDREVHEGDIHGALKQYLGLVTPVDPENVDGDVGVRVAEGLARGGELVADEEADGKDRMLPCYVCDTAPRHFGSGQQSLGFVEQPHSRRRQLHAVAAPQQEVRPDLLLELADLAAEYRLRDVQTLCGPSEMKLLRHGYEVPKLAQVQRRPGRQTHARRGSSAPEEVLRTTGGGESLD